MMKRVRRATSLMAISGMVAALTVAIAAPPAQAVTPDPGVSDLVAFLDNPTGSLQAWSKGLGTLGKLADALPAVQTSPGSALGFDDLLHNAFNAGTKKLANAVQDGDLNIDEPITIAGNRTGTLTTVLGTSGSDKTLSVDVAVGVDVLDQPLQVGLPIGADSNAPQSAFSSTGGVKLHVAADLKFDLVWDSSSQKVYIRVGTGATPTPSLKVDAHAEFSDKTAVKASIGILGVGLVNDATSGLTLDAHFVGTVSDPNNDGRLAFTNTDGSSGELAQPGSLAGLVSFGLASPAGSLHADLHLQVDASGSSIPLPAVDATIHVDWPDLAVGTPSVTASGLPSVGKFLNMTPRDLVVGIAQLVTSLTSIQRAKSKSDPTFGNLNLPFLKGTLADAIQINERLKTFLTDWTYPGPSDPNFVPGVDDAAKAGQPKFVSLQGFLDKLDTVLAGTGGGVSNVGYDDASSKLAFTLSLKHSAPANPVDLNAAAAASTGPATSTGHPADTTYTSTGLTDANQNWKPNEFVGRHVVAGSSGGTILSNTSTTLTLDSNGWSPSTPTANQPYAVSGMSGDVGTVALGNSLQTPDTDPTKPGHGVANANSVNATAKMTPSFDASVTLVLDLQPPTLHDPPIEKTNPDGSTVLVSSEPTGADRVLLRTTNSPLFTADFPIDAGIDLYANAGFLQVHLKGSAHVCQTGAAADCSTGPAGGHMLEIDLKDQGDITFGKLVSELLSDPKQLLDVKVKIKAVGDVAASIPGASAFFGGTDPHAGFHWNDLTVLDPADAAGPHFDFPALSDLAKVDFDPSNPRALFSVILKTLQTLDTVLGSNSPTGPAKALFDTKIPVLGRSLGDLLKSDESGIGPQVTYTANTVKDASRSDVGGQAAPNAFPSSLKGRTVVVGGQVGVVDSVTHDTLTMVSNWGARPADGAAYTLRSELDDVLSILENSPSDTMQNLVDLLNARLGHTVPITFVYADGPEVGGVPSLIVKLNWKRSFHTSAPVQFDFHLPIGDQKLAGVQGSGSVALGASGEVTLGLVVPLKIGDGPNSADALKITDDSGIKLNLDASVDGSLATTIGPLSLSLGDPTPNATDTAKAKASYSVSLGKPGGTGTAESFSDYFGDVAPAVNANSSAVDCGFSGGTVDLSLCARLPLYISTGGAYTKLITTVGASNEFAVRLPKSPQNGQALDVVDPTGGTIDGHPRIETPDPTELGTAIASHLIDLTRIDGIDGFLNLLQQSLQTASFGGKLPLVGKDLQQGADFLGKLKKTIDDAIGNLASVNSISGLRDWVNTKLAAGLQSAGLNPDLVKVDTQCKTKLGTVGAPTVEVVTAADAASTTYHYAVASYVKDSSGQKHEANPSPLGDLTTGPAFAADGVSPSKPLKVSWTAVAHADGYRIFRKDGADLELVGDVTTTDFTDDGTATPGAGPANPSGANPFLTDCSFSDFDSVLIRLDVSNGNFSGDTLDCGNAPSGHECLSKTVPLDIGIPGLSLKAATPGDGPKVELGWRLHLAFGISRSDGFFVDTKDGDPQPEFAVGLNFALPAAISAQLAFINVTASNCLKSDTVNCDSDAPAAAQPLFGGTFKIDIKSPHPDGRLTLSDLSSATLSDLFDVKLHAGVNIDWLLKASVAGDAGAGFPGIQAELRLKWAWNNVAPQTNSGADALQVSFNKVAIDTGAVFGSIIGPIIRQIKKVTGPLDPVIKTLYAPIPVLSDLSHLVGGDDVTLVSIAKAFSTVAGGPDLTFVDRVLKVIQLVNNLPDGDHVLIPIGSFSLVGSKALDTSVTPDNTGSLIDAGSKVLSAEAGGASGVLDALDSHSGTGKPHILNAGGADAPAKKAGFSFPVFEHPASLFNLLLGGDVDLVKFDSGPLTLGFDWRQEFGPVYAPPPVLITLHGSASVTMHIVAGFDTYGIRKAVEAVRDGTFTAASVGEAILQSLFFYTTDDKGQPIPVVQFTGELAAGAEVSAVIITVGIEGGVGLTVSFLWNDPNHDGKFRLSEFVAAALNNPICLFSVSGRVYVFLKLFVKIGFGPFSVSFSFTIVDVTLLDFSATPDCSPPPPKTGALGDGGKTLIVYAAALGDAAHRGDPNWDSNNEDKDTVKITSLHNYDAAGNPFKGVSVEMLGIRNEFLNANIERVIVDGRGYNRPMAVTFLGDGKQDTSGTGPKPPTLSFEKDAIVFGGKQNDQIKTGIGNSWVDGGEGDDTIVTGDQTVLTRSTPTGPYSYVRPDAKAWVAGGPGNDNVTVGNGDDRVCGDCMLTGGPTVAVTGLKELKNSKDSSVNVDSGDPTEGVGNISVPDWTKLPEPGANESGLTAGDDVLSTGLGAAKIFGNGGNDTLSVASDDPLAAANPAQAALFRSAGVTLVGGTGNDNVAGGSGPDTIVTGPDAGGLNSDPDANGGADDGSVNIVDTGAGNDVVYGSTGVDRVTGHSTASQHDDIRGGAGEDILIGGLGTDKVFGGPGDDYVIAEPSTVDLGSGAPPSDGFGPLYTVTHTPLPDGTTASSKTLVGGTGNDHIIGGDGGAAIDGDTYNAVVRCGPGATTASDPVSEAGNLPSDGNDKITGGSGVDNVRAGGGNDLVDVLGNDDLACGESGADALHGGTGNDQIWGGSGVDSVFGDAGNDSLYGNDQNDALYGGDQNDLIEGNNGSDFASGGAGNDVILGGTQLAGRPDQGDTLSGDNGDDTIIGDNGGQVGGVWTPLDLSGAVPGAGGADTIYGGNDNDTAFGGLADDTMFGGAGNDHFEGNNGADTISGEDGEDELVGGGSQTPSVGVGYPDGSDTVSGGQGADVITGDNAIVTTGTLANPVTATDTTLGRGFAFSHSITLLDLGYTPTAGTSDGDQLSGDAGTDVIYGQGGADTIAGGTEDDYAEGGPGIDTIHGNAGEDDLVGGSSTEFGSGVGQPDTGDVIAGDDGADVVIGDNGTVLRTGTPNPLTNRSGMTTQRRIVLEDLGASPHVNSSGDDVVTGDAGNDVVFGQGGNDRLKGNAGDDYVEGDQGSDWIEGNAGDDDLVGGSSTPLSGSGTTVVGQADTGDAVFGGSGDDAVIGDNALLLRSLPRTSTFDRLGTGSSAGQRIASRNLALFDLGTNQLATPAASQFGDDRLSGGTGVDVLYGQDGNDQISGGPDGDYLEGNGGADILRGDALLSQAPTTPGEALTSPLPAVWPGAASLGTDLEGDTAIATDGQDDMIGGSSLANFRDTGDAFEGDGESDFQVGDNGVLKRVIQGTGTTGLTEKVFTQRYPDNAAPANAAVVRIGDANGTTRFCTTAQTTCEKAGASGDDVMYGDGGDDTMWGQDGNDTQFGGAGNDDMYGELGDDVMSGDAGNDAMLGDRGGVVDELINPSDSGKQFTVDTGGTPKEFYTGFRQATLDHRVDLLHDINGDAFVGSSGSAAMPHAGLNEGGNDRIRGGLGQDNIHAGFGDDLANGDSGGDVVFGDDGADVLWGGRGCDPVADAAAPDCRTNGVFDDSARGTNDRFVDHIFGGVGGSSPTSLGKKGDVGADVIDWRPRGSITTPGTTCTNDPFPQDVTGGTIDPCDWLRMTGLDTPQVGDNQHHQGTDWEYGGWDRDVMQGDVAANGPNPGDRLLDWNGTYNLYSHCNSAYGGYNDVRQHSPSMQAFLQGLAYGDGAGQVAADASTSGRSAFRELAMVYPGADNDHGSGSAFPTTPGHFDDPNACAGS